VSEPRTLGASLHERKMGEKPIPHHKDLCVQRPKHRIEDPGTQTELSAGANLARAHAAVRDFSGVLGRRDCPDQQRGDTRRRSERGRPERREQQSGRGNLGRKSPPTVAPRPRLLYRPRARRTGAPIRCLRRSKNHRRGSRARLFLRRTGLGWARIVLAAAKSWAMWLAASPSRWSLAGRNWSLAARPELAARPISRPPPGPLAAARPQFQSVPMAPQASQRHGETRTQQRPALTVSRQLPDCERQRAENCGARRHDGERGADGEEIRCRQLR